MKPTQVQYPWQATVRTAAATIISVIAILAIALPILADAMGTYLPESVKGWLLASAAAIVALNATITRLMARPDLDAHLQKLGLGAEPPKLP